MTTRTMSLIVNIQVLLLFVGIFLFSSITFLHTVPVVAQDEDYYQDMEENYEQPQYEENYEEPQYEEYMDNEQYPEEEYQDPDPEFMEQVEPGEYDQSDDVMDMEQNYN